MYAVIPTRMNAIGTSRSTATPGCLAGTAVDDSALAVDLKRDPAEPHQQPAHRCRQAGIDNAQRAVAEGNELAPVIAWLTRMTS